MTYSDKLKDPRWQRKRLEVLNRDGFKCLACGDETSQLQVHHCYYVSKRDPWDYPIESLLTFCSRCHEDVNSDPINCPTESGLMSNIFESAVEVEMQTLIWNRNNLGITCGDTLSSVIQHISRRDKVPVPDLVNMLLACLFCGKISTKSLQKMSEEAIREGYLR